jgi:F-type H+-transporting ATPase subunit alpha
VLRELLKQDRLAPLPIEFQMAWLAAFNRGLFGGLDDAGIASVLNRLATRLKDSGLTLEDSPAKWIQAVKSWLPHTERES